MNDETQLPPKTAAELEFDDLKMPSAARFHYSLVLAEVIFQTDKGVGTHRCQIFSKSDVTTFPANRLAQLQNSAAHQVKGEVTDKNFKALEVMLLGITALGQMTDLEFWGSEAAIPRDETPVVEAAPQQLTSNSDNVVPLQRT